MHNFGQWIEAHVLLHTYLIRARATEVDRVAERNWHTLFIYCTYASAEPLARWLCQGDIDARFVRSSVAGSFDIKPQPNIVVRVSLTVANNKVRLILCCAVGDIEGENWSKIVSPSILRYCFYLLVVGYWLTCRP